MLRPCWSNGGNCWTAKNLIFMKINLFLLTLLISILSCTDLKDDTGQNQITELRACWWCITEDILGFAEGAGIGGVAGGPPGAIIGAALIGSYRSIKEYHSMAAPTSNGELPNYINSLSNLYNTERASNPYNQIGKLHNALLHKLILNKSLITVDDYYNFLINEIKKENEFSNFQVSSMFESRIKDAMNKIHNNQGNSLTPDSEEEKTYLEIKQILKEGGEASFLNKVDSLESSKTDLNSLLVLSVSYHTYYFWKNL